jgi:hypothetical protein
MIFARRPRRGAAPRRALYNNAITGAKQESRDPSATAVQELATERRDSRGFS